MDQFERGIIYGLQLALQICDELTPGDKLRLEAGIRVIDAQQQIGGAS